MALTPQVQASQAGVQSVTEASTDIRVSQAGVLAVGIYPTEFIESSQVGVQSVTEASTDIRASQAGVMVVGRGRVQDPVVRAWAVWLDNHWYYVLTLPTGYTLVWDILAEQWYIWGSNETTKWRAFHGTNWLGSGALMDTYGSNVLVGDDGNGAVYLLDPEAQVDDSAILGAEDPQTFRRRVTGQMVKRGNDYVRCYGVELMGSIGESTLTDVTLYTSDDVGHTFDNQGTVSITANDYSARCDWVGGLGSYTGPGRLFRVEDDGALQRIDWLEMMDGKNG